MPNTVLNLFDAMLSYMRSQSMVLEMLLLTKDVNLSDGFFYKPTCQKPNGCV